MGAEQSQEKRDFFLRTDLDHDDLLFAWLVEASGRGVQDNRVSGLFQACFVEDAREAFCCNTIQLHRALTGLVEPGLTG
ncbi:hypothetical protein F8237_25705 [Bradyrhizobium betae]|uniref:Uncharacterized protein n=1 Tax=Bradyrhizobium betae TaxID=244734 RepID=A0A5P6PB33_9BRAD|nr:hypothetical protein F8237_25705 [Bradyrhizobium betae]